MGRRRVIGRRSGATAGHVTVRARPAGRRGRGGGSSVGRAARVWDRRAVDMQQRDVALRRHGILLKKVSTFFHFDFLRALECIFVEVPSEVRWVFEPIFVGFLRSTSAMRNVPGFQKR